MNRQMLNVALRDVLSDLDYETDLAELLRVLIRVVDGMPLERAFGAPGDWGYSTPIGRALAAPPES